MTEKHYFGYKQKKTLYFCLSCELSKSNSCFFLQYKLHFYFSSSRVSRRTSSISARRATSYDTIRYDRGV